MGFEIVSLKELYIKAKGSLTTPHRANFYHILWFQHCNLTHLVDFNPVSVKHNSVLFLNKDTVQIFDNTEAIDGKAILFTDDFFCQSADDLKFLRSTVLFNDLFSVSHIEITSGSSLTEIFALIEREWQQTKDNYQAEILQNYLHNFLLLAERERRKQNFIEIKKGADLDYVLLFKDLLENQFKTNRQVSQYASQISITEKRLNQATSKVLGKSPKEMIDERVLLEAKRLLTHTTESIKEIGFSLGFDEPTNFIKYFRKHQKVTPVEFRERIFA
ncbi:helix-turn-helix domain-containing protein [Emticicia sp. C21]|nr:helix-turn-helix domain-containing protein [Emticicia sp. C21]